MLFRSGSVSGLELPIDGRWEPGGQLALWRGCRALRFAGLRYGALSLDRSSVTLCPTGGGAMARTGRGGLAIAARERVKARLERAIADGALDDHLVAGQRAVQRRSINRPHCGTAGIGSTAVGVAGFALPGSYVDVLVSAKDEAQQPFSTTVLTRIKVLAVAQETQTDQTKPKMVNAVTLELTPTEAEKLDLARSIGSLSLVLRNDSDTVDVETGGTRLNHILRGDGPTAAAPRAAVASRTRSRGTSGTEAHGAVTSIRGITRRDELP